MSQLLDDGYTVSCGDRVQLKDGDRGVIVHVESTIVGYGEHGKPAVETWCRVRLDVPSITPLTAWVDPSEIIDVLT